MKLVFFIKSKKMPVGTVSKGMKKIAEGKWRPITKGKETKSKVQDFFSSKFVRDWEKSNAGKKFPERKDSYKKLSDVPSNLKNVMGLGAANYWTHIENKINEGKDPDKKSYGLPWMIFKKSYEKQNDGIWRIKKEVLERKGEKK